MSLSGNRKRMALYHGALLDTFDFLINQSSRERLSLSKMADCGSDRSRKFPSPPPLRPRIQRVDVDATYAYLVALFCSNRRKFNYMILAFHEDTFCDNVQSVEKRGMKFRRPWSDRNLCCQGNNRNRSFQKVGNIEDIFLIFFFFILHLSPSLVSTLPRETRPRGERSTMGTIRTQKCERELDFRIFGNRSCNYRNYYYLVSRISLHLLGS